MPSTDTQNEIKQLNMQIRKCFYLQKVNFIKNKIIHTRKFKNTLGRSCPSKEPSKTKLTQKYDHEWHTYSSQ